MIRFGMLMGVAAAESRIARRLVRYWVLTILTSIIGLILYVYYAGIHHFFSGFSASVASINPRFIIGLMGLWYMAIFLFGLIFLGYEIRARDVRERIFEVVDSIPVSNLELVLGRFVGLLRVTWIPVIVTGSIMMIASLMVGQTIEPVSMVNFVFSMALPAFSFTLGLTFFLTLVARYRWLSAILMVVAIVVIIAANLFSPTWLVSLTDVTGAFSVPYPSEMATEFLPLPSLFQRLGIFIAGLGFAILAAGVHPRLDDHKSRTMSLGAMVTLLGFLLLIGTVVWARGERAELAQRKATHLEYSNEPVADLVSITGSVNIEPGKSLSMELEQKLIAPMDSALDRGLFSLNPGLTVESLEVDGAVVTFEQRDGMVVIDWPTLAAGSSRTLRWTIQGSPDIGYGYLDSYRNRWNIKPMDGNLFMLGYENGMFRKANVTLMPTLRWLPEAGSDIGRDDPRVRPTDLYYLDLTMTMPDDWLIAGPGRREELPADGGSSRFRFAPETRIPTPVFVAGRYESRQTEVEGVMLEVMVSPEHLHNLEVMADAVPNIEEALGDTLREAAAMGLDYPFDGLTLVEIPNQVRGYGGGWRMDSVMGGPGLAMMRESGFPTANFERIVDKDRNYEDVEGGIAQVKFDMLEKFFENDFNGGNIYATMGKNFFRYQASASGDFGAPMEWVNDSLSTTLTTGRQVYFSAFLFDRDMGELIGPAINEYANNQDRRQEGFASVFIDMATNSPALWDQVLEVSLLDLKPEEDPKRAINILTLKGNAMAHSLLDTLGSEGAATFLAHIRAHAEGGVYDREDIVAAGNEVGLDLDEWLDLWLDRTELPGFIVEGARNLRLTDDEDGAARYGIQFTLRNEENVPGVFRAGYWVEDEGEIVHLDPYRVNGTEAVRVSIVSRQPISRIRIEPYLSLNRGWFEVILPPRIDDEKVEVVFVTGVQETVFVPASSTTITVDDLSPGFEIVDEGKNGSSRDAEQDPDIEYDAGMPVLTQGRGSNEWSRGVSRTAYGRYRHTFATRGRGKGTTKAVFGAEIPRAGSWELEYYLPRTRSDSWELEVVDGAGSVTPVTFDLKAAQVGWNRLGSVQLDRGLARVEIRDDAGKRGVIVDAIRWIPPRSTNVEEGS